MSTLGMALRVLLADESISIKKVMQLALQDFQVEVKSVSSGFDVVPIARNFKPHIIFSDILLSKKSGYDMSQELKSQKELASIPVILMWSGFMEIDEEKMNASGASDRLEKPFDADTLRNLVKKWVPHLQTNAISNYLEFPPLPDFVEPPASFPVEASDEISDDDQFAKKSPAAFDEADEPEEFQQIPLPRTHKNDLALEAADSESWSHKDLSKFKIQMPGEENSGVSSISPPPHTSRSSSSLTFSPSPSMPNLSKEVAEEILREKAQEMIQELAWKLLPDVIERVVREEIQKLLLESEKYP